MSFGNLYKIRSREKTGSGSSNTAGVFVPCCLPQHIGSVPIRRYQDPKQTVIIR